ncbi:MAG: AraC family transcriptional regulator [Calditrichaeota bacterium]|nr:AraC family transcriptional regulator [Calditrichota bacterium]MCB0268685.1 AraC family transcriptional regulator [Calditrichota bacterium]MCB9070819.1 AraC family transcriptional regulator [Calditrichia bacterium]
MKQLTMHKNIEPFGKDIFVMESDELHTEKKLPFYADGFAGIVYSQSTHPFYQMPRGKKLSEFYLYGQTVEPITLDVKGAYKLFCIRLYPFAVRILLGVDPQILMDDCYDLRQVENVNTQKTLDKLAQFDDWESMKAVIAEYFNELLKNASINPDYRIKLAINLILKSSGTISIKELRDKLCVAERTLERHFLREIGVTPKQFAKIIQFRSAMEQMTEADYVNLTEIGYDNGFADQSHFIRSFKRYTGKTPKEFLQHIQL